MTVLPATLKQANELVKKYHRHHKPVIGHRYSLLAIDGERICGAVIVGRPVARGCDPYNVFEVTRLVTDGTKNACSFLYAAAARVAKEMGAIKIQTYILVDEPGISLKAAGWEKDGIVRGREWKHTSGPRRIDQPNCSKQRWIKKLRDQL